MVTPPPPTCRSLSGLVVNKNKHNTQSSVGSKVMAQGWREALAVKEKTSGFTRQQHVSRWEVTPPTPPSPVTEGSLSR